MNKVFSSVFFISLFFWGEYSYSQNDISLEEFNQTYFDSLSTNLSCSEINELIQQVNNSAHTNKESKDYIYFVYRWFRNSYNNCGNYYETIRIGNILLSKYSHYLQTKPKRHAIVYGDLAESYLELEEYGISLDYYLKARDVYLTQKDSISYLSTESDIARVYSAIGEHKQAIKNYHSILSQKELAKKANLDIASLFIGTSYLKLKELDSASKYLNIALEKCIETNNYFYHAQTKWFFARLHHNTNFNLAEKNYKEGILQYEQLNETDELLHIVYNLCELYIDYGHYNLITKLSQKYLSIAAKTNNYDKISILSEMLFESLTIQKKHKEAIEVFKQYAYATDSLQKQEVRSTKLMAKIRAEAQNEVEHLQHEDLLKSQKIQSQNILLTLTVVGILLLVMIAVVIYRAYIINRKLSRVNANQAQQLQELDEAKSRFFTNISHDLRTPTSLIIGSIEQVLSNEDVYLNNKTERQLKTGLQNGQRIIHLTNEINELIKLEEGRLQMEKRFINLDEFLTLFTLMFSSMAELKGIKLSYSKSIFEDQPIVAVDIHHFERVLFNLISNAIKHSQKGDFITVTLNKEEDKLSIKITDSGEGIPEEHVPYIFERYYQARKNSFKVKEGFGIGLALVKEIIDQHDAEIGVRSKLGEGTEFEIKLRLEKVPKNEVVQKLSLEYSQSIQDLYKDTEDHHNTERPIIVHETKNTEGVANKATVLIVDDHPEVRQLIQDIIEPYYNIITAGNGKKALDVLELKEVDIIITDLMMPWFDGFELLEKLKENPKYNNIPVLVISARTSEEDKLKVISQGVNDFLHKPFSAQELVGRLSNLIKRKSTWNNSSTDALIINNVETLNDIEKSLLSKIEKLITDRVDDPTLTVADLANSITMSERKFFRMVKKLTNCTPFEYIKEIRMNYIKKIIQEKKVATSSEAAKMIGMNNVSHFNSQFKKRFGVKPMELND